MNVGYIQFDVQHEKNRNFSIIEESLAQMDCDLIVLPELSLCGYLFSDKETLSRFAELVPFGDSTQRMLKLSQKYRCAIVFGLAEAAEDGVYNTAVVVKEGCYSGKYRKVHLSDFEKTLFKPGNCNTVFDMGTYKIGVQICFDLWFPEISREQIRQGADLLCVLANFGGESTFTISQTRAIENLTPLVLCNRVGTERSSQMDAYFLGKSTLVDKDGTRLCTAEADMESAASCCMELGGCRSNVICWDFDSEIARHPLI